MLCLILSHYLVERNFLNHQVSESHHLRKKHVTCYDLMMELHLECAIGLNSDLNILFTLTK